MNALVESKNLAPAFAMPEAELIETLQSSLYPGASVPSVKMALSYCRATGLDPMQKPVHIVPMWDSKLQKMRDVIMPGIGLYRTQAARSNSYGGIGEPVFGPEVTRSIGGQEIAFPEWCKVTVVRVLPNGQKAEFTAVERWTENYAVKGGKDKSIAPNAMWTKRPYGQLAKCAQAQALRMAFPEIGSQPTAEEMEGKSYDFDLQESGDATPRKAEQPARPVWPDDAFETQFARWNKAVSAGLKTVADIEAMAASKGDLTAAQKARIAALKPAQQSAEPTPPAASDDDPPWQD